LRLRSEGDDARVAYIAVGIAGMAGALLRYELGRWIQVPGPSIFPYGTGIINLIGCFALGLLTPWFARIRKWPPAVHTGITSGLIGSFTTFSTFALETVELLRAGRLGLAAAYVVASAFGGLLMAALGAWLGRRILAPRKEESADARS